MSMPAPKTSLVLPHRPEESTINVPSAPKSSDTAAVTAASLIAGKTPMVQVSSHTVQQTHPEVIESRIVAYYYAALSNVLCQAFILCSQQVDEDDAVKMIIDASYRDFHAVDSWFSSIDPNEIRANANASLYREVRDAWSPQVRDWRTISSKSRGTS